MRVRIVTYKSRVHVQENDSYEPCVEPFDTGMMDRIPNLHRFDTLDTRARGTCDLLVVQNKWCSGFCRLLPCLA